MPYTKQSPSQEESVALAGVFNHGRYAEAERLAFAMTEAFADHPIARKGLGAVLRQTGRREQALGPLQRATELSPNDAEAHSNPGDALKDLNALARTRSYFRAQILASPLFDARRFARHFEEASTGMWEQ